MAVASTSVINPGPNNSFTTTAVLTRGFLGSVYLLFFS
jgi:threonine/homoserine/homoserine lactone efflux protein